MLFLWGVVYVACMGQACLSMLETYKRSQNLEWNTWLVIPCLFVVCYRLLVLLAVIFSFVQYIVDRQLFSHSRPGRVKFQVSLELLYNCFFFKTTSTTALLQALCLSWLAFMVAIIYIFLLLIYTVVQTTENGQCSIRLDNKCVSKDSSHDRAIPLPLCSYLGDDRWNRYSLYCV